MAINGFGAMNSYQPYGGQSLAQAYAQAAPAPMGGLGDCSSFSPESGGCCGQGAAAPTNLNLALAINFGEPAAQPEAPPPAKKAARKKKKGHGGPLNWSAMRAIAAGRLPGHAQISIPQQLKNMGMGGHK